MFRRTSGPRGVPSSRIALRDLAREATAGILQRPARTLLTMLGTVLGIGAFVAILGISETAGGQVDQQFNVLDATSVTVTDQAAATASRPTLSFPRDAERRIGALNGVTSAGVWWQVSTRDGALAPGPDTPAQQRVSATVYAASPGLIAAARPTLVAGAPINSFDENSRQPVVLLGQPLATQLGVGSLDVQPAVYLDGRPFTVIGILGSCDRLPQLTLGAVIPASVAQQYWGPPVPAAPAQMLVTTQLGAAPLIASQAPLALNAVAPNTFTATSAPNASSLKQNVNAQLNTLFLLLAGIAVIIGGLSIANTTLIAVLERTSEIGLRRALGARRRHIAGQFIAEAGAVGLIGGLIGAALGVATTIAVTLVQHWTALLNANDVLFAPLAGGAIGILAGLYPALRAAGTEPSDALRR